MFRVHLCDVVIDKVQQSVLLALQHTRIGIGATVMSGAYDDNQMETCALSSRAFPSTEAYM